MSIHPEVTLSFPSNQPDIINQFLSHSLANLSVATEERTPHQDGVMPLDEYRRLLRISNWRAFNTQLYLEQAEQGVNQAANELYLDWMGYFGEHVIRLADQVHFNYTDRGIDNRSMSTLVQHTQNTVDYLRRLQQERVKAANGKFFNPDRAILELSIVRKILELQATNQWIVYISPRGEEHHLYPGTKAEDYVVIYLIKGNEFHQLMTWHTNDQISDLQLRLQEKLGAKEIATVTAHSIQTLTAEMRLEKLFILDGKTRYQTILNEAHRGKETWIINPDESLTTIDPVVVETMAKQTATILKQLFFQFYSTNKEISNVAGSLSKRQQLNLLTEVIQEKFASLAFQTQRRLNTSNYDKQSAEFKKFYQAQMQLLSTNSQKITLEKIRSIWLIRLKEESGQTEYLNQQEKKEIQTWNQSIRIPLSFAKTTSLLHCLTGIINPNLLKEINSVPQLQAKGFNLGQISLIREWQTKGYKLAQFKENGRIIAYMVPAEYDLAKMYFDPNIQDVIGPCGIPLSRDPLAHLVTNPSELAEKNWFDRQTDAVIEATPISKKKVVASLLHRIARAVFVRSLGLDAFLNGNSVKNNPLAQKIYQQLVELLGNVEPQQLKTVAEQLIQNEKLLKQLKKLEKQLGLGAVAPQPD